MTATPERAFPNRLIASPYHTVGLLGLIIALSLITRLFVTSRPATTLRTEHLQVYLLGFSWDWLLFLYVRFGLKRRGVRTIRQVLDDRDWTFVRWLLYLAIAVGLVFLWGALGFALGRFLNIDAEQAARIRSLFPSSLLDKTVWVVLSITAGFCEEFVYRGYLQQQFRAMTGSLSLAVVLQASAFGAAHLAFPWQIALMTVLLGLLVGTVAGWRRSLAPGMLFHAAFDILSGVLS
jgi:uncharacterized protein